MTRKPISPAGSRLHQDPDASDDERLARVYEAFCAYKQTPEPSPFFTSMALRPDIAEAIWDLMKVLYADVRKELHKPAARSVLSHLRKLHDEDVVELAIADASTLSSKTVWVLR